MESEEETVTLDHALRYVVRKWVVDQGMGIDIRPGESVIVPPKTIFQKTGEGWLPDLVINGKETLHRTVLRDVTSWKDSFWGPYHESTLKLFPVFFLRDINIAGEEAAELLLRSCATPFDDTNDDKTYYRENKVFELLRTFPHAIDGFMGQELLFLQPDGAWFNLPRYVFP